MSVEKYFSVKPWPHQLHGVEQCVNKIGKGNRICVCSPTGGGKSKMMEALVRYGVDNGMKVDLKVCRKMLRDQLMDVFTRAGVKFGVRAAGMGHLYDPSQPVQICSTPTENSRILRDDPTWKTTGADLILVDEAHMQVGPSFVKLLNKQCEEGACVVGFTATPIGISQYYNDLVVAGTNSELRACKSHVRAIVKAPFEFDLHKIGRNAIGEYDNGQVAKKIYSTSVVGKILDTWLVNNPEQKPTICFGPDVASSIWLASSFVERGIQAAHIDAKQVWFDGELKNDPNGELRSEILRLYTMGEIKILTNRYVLREGIDLPATYNLILATPFGSLKTYLQAVGRGIRYSAETSDHVLITDHGGNYHRHGSPNLDRDWESIFWMTEEELFKEEKERKEKIERDDLPITCPKCGTVRASGNRCPEPPIGCGFESDFRGRVIIQREGKLKIMKEDAILGISKPKVKTAQELWDSMFWALRNSKSDKPKNFKQMRVLFHAKHGYWAPYGLKRMPRFKHNEATAVRDIKFEDLI